MRGLIGRIGYVNGVLVFFGLAALAGVAVAATGGGGGGAQVCVRADWVLTAAQKGHCPAHEKPLALGTPGPEGQRGADGAAGATGATGPAGGIGPQGTPGEVGLPGERGAPGERGVPGERGEPGAPGTPGAPGAPVEPGAGELPAAFFVAQGGAPVHIESSFPQDETVLTLNLPAAGKYMVSATGVAFMTDRVKSEGGVTSVLGVELFCSIEHEGGAITTTVLREASGGNAGGAIVTEGAQNYALQAPVTLGAAGSVTVACTLGLSESGDATIENANLQAIQVASINQ